MKVQSGKSRSGQAGSESCLPPGDRRERSVDSEEMGCRGFSSEIYDIAEAEVFKMTEGRIQWTVMRGSEEPPESLVLLCYVESHEIFSNLLPQHVQQPVDLTSKGRIARRICSHVTPEVFFGTQADSEDEQVGNCSQHQMMMKASP